MSRKEDSREEIRREVREALDALRKEVGKMRKDLGTATNTWVKTTGKFVQDVSPKVSATLDAIGKSSVAVRNALITIDKQTKPQQIMLLRSYKTLLSKQVSLIEKRLKELTK